MPELKGNLISVKKLTDKGFEVHFKDDQCLIVKDGKTVTRATEDKGLYYLQLIQTALKTTEVNEARCIHSWHNRFGHRDPNAVRILETHKIAEGIDIKPCYVFGACECCIKAKMSKMSVPKKSESRASEILELIHTAVCGPCSNVCADSAIAARTLQETMSIIGRTPSIDDPLQIRIFRQYLYACIS